MSYFCHIKGRLIFQSQTTCKSHSLPPPTPPLSKNSIIYLNLIELGNIKVSTQGKKIDFCFLVFLFRKIFKQVLYNCGRLFQPDFSLELHYLGRVFR